MQAYEFFAMPKNGSLSISEQLRNKITSYVKVIVLADKPESNSQAEAMRRFIEEKRECTPKLF